MRQFTKYCVLFILPFLVSLVLFEWSIQKIPNDYVYKKEFLDLNSNEVEYLLLGNSHTYYGINPKPISPNCFNLAHVAQSIDWDYELLKKYELNWKNLKYIILPIDYFTLFSRTAEGKSPWRVKNYKIYYNIDCSIPITNYFETTSLGFDKNINRIFNYYFSGNNEITCDNQGYVSKKRNHKDLEKTGKDAARIHSKLNFQKLKDSEEILNKIVVLALKNKTKVIFLSCPTYKSYYENLDEKQLKITEQTIKKYTTKYSNCYFFSFYNNSKFNKEDFQDAHHVNERGADKLSFMIKQKIDSIEYNAKVN